MCEFCSKLTLTAVLDPPLSLSSFGLIYICILENHGISLRGGSRTAATSKMERFMIIVNGWKPLTIITKHSILDVAAVLDPPLSLSSFGLIYICILENHGISLIRDAHRVFTPQDF